MSDDLNDEVFKAAIDTWGEEAQVGMCIEEMGEALAAINHFKRKRIEKDKLIEEFVDVYIMMRQMRFMNQHLFDQIFRFKVNRIRHKLGLTTNPCIDLNKVKQNEG